MRDLAELNASAAGDYGLDMLNGEVAASGHALELPAQFSTFMADPALRDSVPTCTSCYWEKGLPAVASPVYHSAKLVRFLNDQQGCLYWYLYLLDDGCHQVVCGRYCYDQETVPLEEAATDLLVVADSFDEFIARFWIENLAWYEVVGQERSDDQLSAPVWAYVRQLQREDPETN